MPVLDGFGTAALIKRRERTKHIPIIFVTAISKDDEHVFRGYSSGAVDYIFKPFSPEVMRSKVSVFIELHEKNEQLRRQVEQLKEQELTELRRESEKRYRFLAEAQPDQIWTALPNGELDYVNQRALDYLGTSFSESVEVGWTQVMHPDDLPRTIELWQRALDTAQPYENEIRLRRADDSSYRWHLTRAVPMRSRNGKVVKWFGSNTDIHDRKRAEEAQQFLVEAGARLGRPLDDLHLELVRELGFQSYMCVPLVARGRTIGVISFVVAESGRRYGEEDLALAEELARRSGTAVENAQLYREAEERAQAARVLETVGDGVFLVDLDGIIRIWNRAAEAITGLSRSGVVGRVAEEVLPGWHHLTTEVPVAGAPGPAAAVTLPLELDGEERWLSISGVGFDEGTVYAFRDLTEERALEQIRKDLVATVSHELRTPLAAIYGSALTLAREDLELEEAMHRKLLEVIVEESTRLADIVNDLLLASQLDADRLELRVEPCDAHAIAARVLDAARTHLPEGTRVSLDSGEDVPRVAADEGQLRQALTNLSDNAVKYSPTGGDVHIRVEAAGEYVRFTVADEGLGIPPGEQSRIFEKFYRLDPDMTGGIGGTGPGLYISRELVRRVHGRIWVEPHGSRGSIFNVEIPAASEPSTEPKRRKRAGASA